MPETVERLNSYFPNHGLSWSHCPNQPARPVVPQASPNLFLDRVDQMLVGRIERPLRHDPQGDIT